MGAFEGAAVAGVVKLGGGSSRGTSLEHAVPSPGALNQNQVE